MVAKSIRRSRVRETSASTGTGNITLAGASGTDLTFSPRMAVGDAADVFIGNSTMWEVANCTLLSIGPSVLQRNFVIENSADNLTPTNFSGGTLDVWIDVPGRRSRGSMPMLTRTANYKIDGDDDGCIIRCTTNSFTLSFDPVANLGPDWSCEVRNVSTGGDVTLDPDGTEQIDGLTSFILYPGEHRRVFCDGIALRSVIMQPGSRIYAANGSFTQPPGISGLRVDVIAGGGGGGRPNTTTLGGTGGGGGARLQMDVPVQAAGTITTVTVGAVAAGATANNTNGTAGNNSSFGTFAVATGGLNGRSDATGANGGSGMVAHVAAANANALGLQGTQPSTVNDSLDTGQHAEWGGGAGAPAGVSATGKGGSSLFGGGGGGSHTANGNTTGQAGGTSGAYTSGGGGAGGGGATSGTATAGSDGAAVNGGAGSGGGGGGSNSGGTGGKGGNGGTPGGGGGGGGNGSTSGNGGDGARGEVRVTWW